MSDWVKIGIDKRGLDQMKDGSQFQGENPGKGLL